MTEPVTVLPKTRGTKGTQGTAPESRGFERFPDENLAGNSGNLIQPSAPADTVPDELSEPEINRPEFRTHDDWFAINGNKYRPGLYWHGSPAREETEPVNAWICTPIHADAITANECDEDFGLLLRFVNPNGQWREWAAPMRLLKGSGEELRGELLNLGVRIDPQGKRLLLRWLMGAYPKDRIIAAGRTGWHGESFVLPRKTIGAENVRFQSEHATFDSFTTAGTRVGWRENVAIQCIGNDLLILALSAAFAGPLLKRAKLQESGGAGIHLIGDSSQGKTTALQVAASVWGSPSFVRTWRATSNGLEATAAALNDTALVIDEISECDPKEVGAIVYALANGAGKQRAARTGGARKSARWRIIFISSGERSLSAHMAEGGRGSKAGQLARMLDVPATMREFGVFDELHEHPDGRSFADALKQAAGKHCGHAGPAFIESLLADERDLPALYAKVCAIPGLKSCDGLESRAASVFALIGLAGELATEYGLTGWVEGEAIKGAQTGFNLWREFRGQGQTESRQILQSVRDFILRNGDAHFSDIAAGNNGPVRDRAGYWRDSPDGRIYLFNSPAIREAATGFDLRRILTALDSDGWIVDHDIGKRSKKVKVAGTSTSLYAIRPAEALHES